MNKRAFIFDLDGTLADAYPAIIESFNFTMKRMGYPLQKPVTIRRAVGWGDVQLLKPFLAAADLNSAIRIYRTHHIKSLKRMVRLMPHALSMLSCLKARGFSLAIASNRPTRFTHIILKKLGIDSFFDQVLCADKLKYGKPNPMILNLLSKRLEVPKKYICYVGDMVLDIVAGQRASIDTIAVTTGSSSINELKKAKPTYIFKDLKALKQACHACKQTCS